MKTYLKLEPTDTVLVALQDLPAGTPIVSNGHSFTLPRSIPAKHKFVLHDLTPGDPVTMYGVLVGKATQPIGQGEQITTFNLRHEAEPYSTDRRKPQPWLPPDVLRWQGRSFMGYHRSDGRVGTANYWLVLPLVFCENRNIQKLKDAFERELGYAQPDTYQQQVRAWRLQYETGASMANLPDAPAPAPKPYFANVDGIKFLTHEMGCGGTNQDSALLAALFAAYANHPNVAGLTVLSLGCQKTQYDDLLTEIQKRNPAFDKPILFFEQQQYGTEFAMLSDAIGQTFAALTETNKLTRQPAPLSKLVVGLKCGGSDGFSGISANPALGYLSDVLVALGGTTLLAEFPELCGVEQNLIDRCVSEEKARKFETLMREYAAKAEAVGAGFDMNPSVGNIKDGLITDAIKSAGAAKKGGTAPIVDVLNYTEIATQPGLHLVCTPGNDVLATTGKAAAGATIILFTTGLGTPTGNPICPVAKVATNTALAQKMPDIIDFDCGPIVRGEQTIGQSGDALLEYVIRLASGEVQTKAQQLGQDDFIPWQFGVSL
ncbi:UxaA family hydrolase [Spirosoma montaniterrae]|uniref:Altronate hydrolase n=1 Tax=Spirosoma montaniterrae TaxID=1178516 RepID=A0A1P9WWX3_9BACT|nr:altronate dehydratase family protein [Spirosoma montaniterrae]AQG79892.1 altronate hydrolase [Spirosoma montaniterrae]